jgi:hypothetical protein
MALIHISARLDETDRVVVTYDSVRSDEHQTRSGTVERVQTEPDTVITFQRSDGQHMKVTDDRELLSVGSRHPFTGTVTDVKVDAA